jgi:hypothetical protein
MLYYPQSCPRCVDTKEGKAMRKHWLRGILLGVSLAMLLASGVALAQGLFMTVDKECVECWPGDGFPTGDQYLLRFTIGGWNTNYDLCGRTTIDGVLLGGGCDDSFPPEDPFSERDFFPCEWPENTLVTMSLPGGDVSVSNGPPNPLGKWVYHLWQEIPGRPNPSAWTSWIVAEVCEVEFVPEPGTILLLGSGLAGLAGYASLRWRTRE